jgi:hypothetical protein
MKVYELIEALMGIDDHAVVTVDGQEVKTVTAATDTVDTPDGEVVVERAEIHL